MNSVIDCDSVFEVLTQAPFPTGRSSDQDVENHLRVCHECRCLAEALRPAVGLFHESLADDKSLPRYDGQLAQRVARLQSDSGWTKRIAAVVAAGLAACLLTWLSYVGTYRQGWDTTDDQHRTVMATPDSAGLATLCSLPMSSDCSAERIHRAAPWHVLDVAAKPLINADDFKFACCTQCHRAGGTGPASALAMRALDAACAACHRPPATATAIRARIRIDRPLALWSDGLVDKFHRT